MRYEGAQERTREMVDDTRYRMYLAGRTYAFEHAWTAIHQIVAVKVGHSGADYPLPRMREYMY